MPSPFPGMDPYLERHWLDVHADLVALSRTAMEERVVIDSVPSGRSRAIYPDVRVYEDAQQGATPVSPSGGNATVAEPIILELDIEEHTETFITILDTEGEQLVTAIEFLGPANKLPSEGRDQYRKKRDQLFATKVNVVEVDLVRQGSWRELLAPMVAPATVRTTYRATIRRFHPQQRVEFYPFSLRQPLPGLLIPLRDGDKDVRLDLQSLVAQAYRNGRYDRTDYSVDCRPPLDGDDEVWAGELLLNTGLRHRS